jgi:hypothetical protein
MKYVWFCVFGQQAQQEQQQQHQTAKIHPTLVTTNKQT